MLSKLPGWAIDDTRSVREEVAEWAGTSVAERWQLATLCARDAVWAAAASGNAQRIFDQVDPLPASTLAALARLRRQMRWGDAGR